MTNIADFQLLIRCGVSANGHAVRSSEETGIRFNTAARLRLVKPVVAAFVMCRVRVRIATRHSARNARVFGSVVRGEDRFRSDVDLLVEMENERSFLELVGLEEDLEELLQRKVDVLTD